MIIGLGSVGNYLLDYLVSVADENMEICVVGRNENKMESDVNIVRGCFIDQETKQVPDKYRQFS